jgi:hypothetical protein
VLISFPHGSYVPVSGNGMRLLFHGYSRLYALQPLRRGHKVAKSHKVREKVAKKHKLR